MGLDIVMRMNCVGLGVVQESVVQNLLTWQVKTCVCGRVRMRVEFGGQEPMTNPDAWKDCA